jgi:hypothetical protein
MSVDTRAQRTVTSSILTTFALLVASLSAAVVLTGDDAVWTAGSGAMIAVGHILLTAIVVVAALVGAARWSVGLGLALAALLAIPAVLHPIDPAWVVMVVTAGLAAGGLAGTGLRGAVRQRPAAAGPPRKAVALTLGLLCAPLVIGSTQPSGVDATDWALVAASLALGFWYSKARPTAVWATRLGIPLLAVVSVLIVAFPQALAAVAFFSVLTWLAWSADARLAVIPLLERGRSVPIPPELAPGEILDAAGLDSRGRRKEKE